MERVVGIRFKKAGKIYYFSPGDFELTKGQHVLVETSRGVELGTAVSDIMEIPEDDLAFPLKPIVKIATDEDLIKHKENKIEAQRAYEICVKEIEKHELDMNLVSTEYTFDNNRLIFYFTSDDRVDFRDLVKDLAAIFKTRIELRQIGVRDKAKMVGGLGCCGREVCCKTFLCEFEPVTIKMAKDQSFSLNPTKISGVCGRLMCCLGYEQEGYEELLSRMPDVGSVVNTTCGRGVVCQISPLQEMVRVKIENEDEITEENISLSEIIADDKKAVIKNKKSKK